MKVRVKRLSEDVPEDFICNMLFGALDISVEDCEKQVKSQGFVDLQIDPEKFKQMESLVKRYSFLSVDILSGVPVRVVFKGDTSVSLACNILSGILGYRVENCERAFLEKGEIHLDLSSEMVNKLMEVSRNYPFFHVEAIGSLSPQQIGAESKHGKDAFSESWALIKENPGFFFAYSVVWALFTILSMIPFFGFIFSFISSLLMYSTLLYISVNSLLKERKGLEFFNIKRYIPASFGINVGSWVLLIAVALLFLFILFPLGFVSGLGGVISESEIEKGMLRGMLSGFIVWALLLLTFMGYYIYAIPLIYTKSIRSGLTLEAGFKAVFYPFTPSGIKEAFSNAYFRHTVYWLVFITVVGTLALVSAVTIVLIPVALILLCWMLSYTALVIRNYIASSYKSSL